MMQTTTSLSSLEDKTHDEMVYSSTSRRKIPRRNSLRLLTATPNIPVPPSLQKSPYLTSESIFSCRIPSPIRPTEEDEKWLQDTIPLPSRHHVQLTEANAASAYVAAASAAQMGGCVSESWSIDRKSRICGSRLLSASQFGAVTAGGRHHYRRHVSDSYGDSSSSAGQSLGITNLQTSKFLPHYKTRSDI